MDFATAQQRIQHLSTEINRHNYQYYVLDKPLISDYDFDRLLDELIKLEKAFPELASPNSPTQRVGGGITKEFKTVKHKYPMLSLGNTYSEEELTEFDNRIRKAIGDNFEYVAELKFDGLAISLTYKNGELVQALTRGDGTQGDEKDFRERMPDLLLRPRIGDAMQGLEQIRQPWPTRDLADLGRQFIGTGSWGEVVRLVHSS